MKFNAIVMNNFAAKIILITFISTFHLGCAHLPTWLGGSGGEEQGADETPGGNASGDRTANTPPKVNMVKYSETAHAGVPTDRSYRRMTRAQMEEESELGSSAGSMWNMDGQSSYLFAQNKSRKEGDVLKINLDESAMKQIETKVTVIKKLLKELEEQLAAEKEARRLASIESAKLAAGGDAKDSKDEKKDPNAVAAVPTPPPPVKKVEAKVNEKEEKQNLDEIKVVSSRIVEKLPDGNFRIKGAQPFMIGKREYKVIVTGLIRPEDFNDEGIGSQKLLDPQYDVVSLRKKTNEIN